MVRVAWIFSNAVAVISTLVCMSYLFYACRPMPRGKIPVLSMLFSADGHGVGLVVGGAVASLLPLTRVTFRSKETDTFAEPSSA